jgi:hypothetical protein
MNQETDDNLNIAGAFALTLALTGLAIGLSMLALHPDIVMARVGGLISLISIAFAAFTAEIVWGNL